MRLNEHHDSRNRVNESLIVFCTAGAEAHFNLDGSVHVVNHWG